MARTLPLPRVLVPTSNLQNHVPQHHSDTSVPALPVFLLIMAAFSVLSIATFLCLFHHKKSDESSEEHESGCISIRSIRVKRLVSKPKLGSSISSKALLMAKMISWRKRGDYEDGGDDDDSDESESALWRKTIIKGERCRPLDFSGKIEYDSMGNQLIN